MKAIKFLNNVIYLFIFCLSLSACNSGSATSTNPATNEAIANNTTSNALPNKVQATAIDNLDNTILLTNKMQAIINHPQLKNAPGIDGSPITALTKDQNGNVYAGTDSGNLWELKNRASSWVAVNNKQPSPDNHAILAIAVVGNNVYTTTTLPQSWLSKNNTAWQKLDHNSTSTQPQYFSSLTVDNGGNIYAGAWNGTHGSIFKLSSKATSWEKLADLPGSYNGLISAIAIDNNSNIYVGSTSIDKITTGNRVLKYAGTWKIIGESSPDNSPIDSLAINSSNDIYAATESGNVMTLSGSSWSKVGGVSPDNSPINSLVIDSSNNIYAGTESGYVYSSNGVGTWLKLPSVSNNISPIGILTIDSNGTLYAGANNGYVYKYSTSNLSNNWQQIIGGTGSITTATTASDGTIFAATSNNTVWKYGANTPTQQLGNSPDGSGIVAMTIDRNNDVYVLTNNENVLEYPVNASNWQQLGSTFTTQAKAIAVSNDGSSIYVGDFNGNIWQYQEGYLNSWASIATILNFAPIYTYGGSYYGDTPQNCGSGIPCDSDPIIALTTDSNNNLYAEAASGSVWNVSTMLTPAPNSIPYNMFPNYWGVIANDLVSNSNNSDMSSRSMVISGQNSYTMTVDHIWQCSTTNINLVCNGTCSATPSCNELSNYYGYTLSPAILSDNFGNIYTAGQSIETNLSTVFQYPNGQSPRQTVGHNFSNSVISLTTDSNGTVYTTTTAHSWRNVALGSWQNTGKN